MRRVGSRRPRGAFGYRGEGALRQEHASSSLTCRKIAIQGLPRTLGSKLTMAFSSSSVDIPVACVTMSITGPTTAC